MHVPEWLAWSRQDTVGRAVAISLMAVAVMVLAQVLAGVGGGSPIWDITSDPASGFLPF